eukprot:CFRG7734T1
MNGVLVNIGLLYIGAQLCHLLCAYFGGFNPVGIKHATTLDEFLQNMPQGWVPPFATPPSFGMHDAGISMTENTYGNLVLLVITICIDFVVTDVLLLLAYYLSALALAPALAHAVLCIGASGLLLMLCVGVWAVSLTSLRTLSWMSWFSDKLWWLAVALIVINMLGRIVEESNSKEQEEGEEKVMDSFEHVPIDADGHDVDSHSKSPPLSEGNTGSRTVLSDKEKIEVNLKVTEFVRDRLASLREEMLKKSENTVAGRKPKSE